MTLSEELAWRGFVNQTTYQDPKSLDGEPVTFYLGADPSASSMTVGNLAVVMMVRHFIAHGHRAILLVGGATGMIGDPDGKKQERDLLTLEQIDINKRAIAAQYKQILGELPFELVDNYDWFKDMGYLQFLREVGKHVPMRTMLGRDFVQSRLGEDGTGISYAEFSYSLIQGYDFLHLHRQKGANLQIAGADQWGNSIAGVDLIRRVTGDEAHVWTGPLVINKTTGIKFGKSEGGAIWLDPAQTSPYDFYQFWLNVDDEGVADYLKLYTLLSTDDVEAVMAEFDQNKGGRAAQKRLAYEVTKIVHGQKTADDVVSVTDLLFTKGNLSEEDYVAIKNVLEPIVISLDWQLSSILVELGLAKSNSEALKFIQQGAVRINQIRLTESRQLTNEDVHQGIIAFRRGKNSIAIARTE